jgi:hypothetical protein
MTWMHISTPGEEPLLVLKILSGSSDFPIYFLKGFLCLLSTSDAPQWPAHGTVQSQVATHLRIDRVCRVPILHNNILMQ